MIPVFVDIHIHTSENPDQLNEDYDLDMLIKKISEFCEGSVFLISITDHNTVNKKVYLEATKRGVNLILGVELHIKNYDGCPAYHCHIYFNLPEITEAALDDINKRLNQLYPRKVVEKMDVNLPDIRKIINAFDIYDFILLPHGGQSHATFDMSIPEGVHFDSTLEKSIYYNQIDGFTARGDAGLQRTQSYFRKLGINDFVNLVTCSDNYVPEEYPKGKDRNAFKPTWMLAQPTFDGLRLSLSERSRLIYSEKKPKYWSETIKNVTHSRENIEIDVMFTPGLNVIIGGSSSGKTLLADSVARKLCGAEAENDNPYLKYDIGKIEIDNPSGMTPHYLSQNYIMTVVNKVTDDDIESIEIIKKVFPGADAIKDAINKGLRSFKGHVQELVKCVRTIEDEEGNLNKISIFSRLVTREGIAGNIFEIFIPNETERERIEFSDAQFEEFVENLDVIDLFLARYPFVKHERALVARLKDELYQAVTAFRKEIRARNLIQNNKTDYDRYLRTLDSESQTKKQDFERLLGSLKKYVRAARRFAKVVTEISSYSIRFDTEEVESMGHKLYIENAFALNKEMFLEVVNGFIKDQILTYRDIEPRYFFESNFKKKPKVRDYDDFESKIYGKFEELNRKKYRIITKEGKPFDDLSPGWKTSVILDLILGYDKDNSPIIIDQPEDNLATNYINHGLVEAIKSVKARKQVILVSHNATIPMLADAQNIILCRNESNKLIIKSSPLEGTIDGRPVLDYIAEITDGGKASIKKRVKKYNLKKFSNDEANI